LSCWGAPNFWGELGNGTTTASWEPVPVTGITDATAVDAGWHHTCALHTGGSVSCWGVSPMNGSAATSSTPVTVAGLSGATAISTGTDHTCAVHSGGAVSCWGLNDQLQLGLDPDITPFSATPVAISGVSDAIAVDAGSDHTCVLRSGGTVSCWGTNTFGQLGNSTTTSSLTPVAVTGLTTASTITVGFRFSCARRVGGSVVCWGWNNTGELGNGTTTNASTPVAVTGLTDALEVNAGQGHACARRSMGAGTRCWGLNNEGQLGDGTVTQSLVPVAVSGLSGTATIGAGTGYSCAVHPDGTISCWGVNQQGELGVIAPFASSVPVAVV
jgi:alpha-tubulin suppressor-like RCC1 family protein